MSKILYSCTVQKPVYKHGPFDQTLILVFIFIAFAAHFYLKLVGHKSEVYEHNIKELQLLKDQLDDTGDIESQTKNIV